MAAYTSTAQTGIRSTRTDGLRDMQLDLCPVIRPQIQAPVHNDNGGIVPSSTSLPALPSTHRGIGPLADVRDDNERYHIKGKPMTLDRVKTAIFLQIIENFHNELRAYYDDAFLNVHTLTSEQ